MTEQKHDDARGASRSDAGLWLKPCPFCGNENNLSVVYSGQPAVVVFVRCRECGGRGPEDRGPRSGSRSFVGHVAIEDAMSKWNSLSQCWARPGEDRP